MRIFQENYDENLYKLYMEYDKCNYGLKLDVGSIVEGTLMGQNSTHIMIDVGYKDFVMVENKRDEYLAIEKMGIEQGATVQVMITHVSEKPYQILGSFQQIDRKDAFKELIESSDTRILYARVLDWSPAGFRLDIVFDDHKIQAFMPNTLAGINKLSQEQSQLLVNKDIEVMIESFSDERGTFIASRKKYLQTLVPDVIEKLKIRNDDGSPIMLSGIVTGTSKTGVYIEFDDCLTGMIHITNLDPQTARNIDQIKSGDNFNFYVKEIINNKLFLTQMWRVTIWDTIEKGSTFNNVSIADIKKFGALVRLDDETVGLINNYEIEHSKRSVKVGDVMNVKVSNIDRYNRKLSLSIIQ